MDGTETERSRLRFRFGFAAMTAGERCEDEEVDVAICWQASFTRQIQCVLCNAEKVRVVLSSDATNGLLDSAVKADLVHIGIGLRNGVGRLRRAKYYQLYGMVTAFMTGCRINCHIFLHNITYAWGTHNICSKCKVLTAYTAADLPA